jgi:hypothetical protein
MFKASWGRLSSLANMGERSDFIPCMPYLPCFCRQLDMMQQIRYYLEQFLFAVYFLPLVGGIIADKVLGYGKQSL